MASIQYSQEQIEQKRLLALQKRKDASSKKEIQFNSGKIKEMCYKQIKNLETITVKNKNNRFEQNNKYNVKNGPMKSIKNNNRFSPIEPKLNFYNTSTITGKCYMIDYDRFTVETSYYLTPVIEIFKTISTKLYDAKIKQWNFHINDYEHLMSKLTQSGFNINITQLPRTVLQIFRKHLNSDHKIFPVDLSKIDTTLTDILMPFQEEGICFGISKHGCCIIADDMGLGKTIQALGIACYFKENWPLLIVAPSSVRYQWSEAIYNFLPSVPTHYIHQFTNSKDFVTDKKIIIVSYDLLVKAIDFFEKLVFGFIILDESHIIKNAKTARYKAVQRIVSHMKHIVLLSGTPALSRPIELYSQINLIKPNFMGYQEYGIRYCAGEQRSFGWDFQGSSNTQELKILLKIMCMIRRLKSDVLNQLPSKLRQIVILDPLLVKKSTKEMINISDKLEKKVLSGIEKHKTLVEYYNESSIARLKAVCNHITSLFENKKKCLIYAHHQNVLNAICNIAESMKIRYIRIDGKTSPKQRKYQVDEFQEHDDCLAAILSITAANTGLTLTAAQLVVFAELFWNPGILCQAEDRVHRIGQNDNVLIQYLVAKQTADDYLWPLVQQKLNVLTRVGLDQNLSFKEANVAEQISKDKQLRLDFFKKSSDVSIKKELFHEDLDEHAKEFCSSKNKETEEKELITAEELQQLDFNEDFNFCD